LENIVRSLSPNRSVVSTIISSRGNWKVESNSISKIDRARAHTLTARVGTMTKTTKTKTLRVRWLRFKRQLGTSATYRRQLATIERAAA